MQVSAKSRSASGFWRCGHHWSPDGSTYDLTEAQAEQIANEPALVVYDQGDDSGDVKKLRAEIRGLKRTVESLEVELAAARRELDTLTAPEAK